MTENEILRRVARDYNLLCGLTPAVAEWVGLLLFSPTPHEWNVRHNPALLLISPNPSHMRYPYLLVRGAGFETFDGTGKGGSGSTALLPSAPASRTEKKFPLRMERYRFTIARFVYEGFRHHNIECLRERAPSRRRVRSILRRTKKKPTKKD